MFQELVKVPEINVKMVNDDEELCKVKYMKEVR